MNKLPEHVRKQLIQTLSDRPEVQRIVLFGSRSRGSAEDRSDIDLAIEAPNATKRQWLDIWFFLKENLETLLSIDVIRLDEAPAELAEKIRSEGEVLYERSEDSPETTQPGDGASKTP